MPLRREQRAENENYWQIELSLLATERKLFPEYLAEGCHKASTSFAAREYKKIRRDSWA